MDTRYAFFDFSNKQGSEIDGLRFVSGEVLLIISENTGTADEKAVFLMFSKQQWEELQRLKPIERAAKMAVGL